MILGSNGEAIMLSDDERRDVLKVSREFIAPEKVLIAGTGCESAINTLALTEYAASLGYDVALVRTPYYYRHSMPTSNWVAYYNYVADRSPIPILIYSVAVFTGYDLPVEAITELSGHPNILGLKEMGSDLEKIKRIMDGTKDVRRSVNVTEIFRAVTGRMLQAKTASEGELLSVSAISKSSDTDVSTTVAVSVAPPPVEKPRFKMRQKDVGFQILTGSAKNLKKCLELGTAGGIHGFASAAPTACYEIYTAFREGDPNLAEEKQQRIATASARISSDLGIPGLKYAMDLNGYYGGPARSPFLPLTGEQRAEVERLMSDIRH